MKEKIKRREGFTLAELLIVVAIIAVLVAISIPIFTAQLEKSREATDLANLRAAKAVAIVAIFDESLPVGEARYYDINRGILTTERVEAGKGTARKAFDDDAYSNEYAVYGYNGADVTYQPITVLYSVDGLKVAFDEYITSAIPMTDGIIDNDGE